MSNYWQERQKVLFETAEKDEKMLFKKLAAEYETEANKLKHELGAFYSKYGKDNIIEYKDLLVDLPPRDKKLLMEDMNTFFDIHSDIAHLEPIRKEMYKLTRLEALEFSALQQQVELGIKEVEEVEKHLMKQGSRGYRSTMEGLGMGKQFLSYDDQAIRKLINRRWLNDKNFSDRIWDNRFKVVNYMNQEFKDGFIRGDNYQKLGRILKDKFKGQSNNNIKRLIYTEGTFVANHASVQPFIDSGYRSYFYDAVLDDRTSDVCEGLHGEEFRFSRMISGVNFPPMHPWCRSSFTVNTESLRADAMIFDELEEEHEKPYATAEDAFKDVRWYNVDKDYAVELEDSLLDAANRYPINSKHITVKANKLTDSFGYHDISTNNKNGVMSYDFSVVYSNEHQKNKTVSHATHLRNYEHRDSPLVKSKRLDVATIYHEYAHAIDYAYLWENDKQLGKDFWDLDGSNVDMDLVLKQNRVFSKIRRTDKMLSDEIFDEMANNRSMTHREFESEVDKELGSYAASNPKEFLAEGFANMILLDDSDKTNFIKEFGKIFNDKFDKIMRGK